MALCVFAMAAVVLGASYLNVLNSYEAVSRGVQIDEDFAFARQIVLNEPDRKKVEEGGAFDGTDGRRATWNAEIVSTTMPDVFTVAFTCELTDPARPTPDKLTQYFTVLRPTWSIDTAERDQLKSEVQSRIYELQGALNPTSTGGGQTSRGGERGSREKGQSKLRPGGEKEQGRPGNGKERARPGKERMPR